MQSIVTKTLQTIKARFDGRMDVYDPERYGFNFLHDKPDTDNLKMLEAWERMRSEYKWPVEITERWNETLSVYKHIQETDSINDIINLLNLLRDYLEIQANRPRVISTLGRYEDGTIYWNQIARSPKYDQFFEDRVLSKIAPAIEDLKRLNSLSSKMPEPGLETSTSIYNEKTQQVEDSKLNDNIIYNSFEDLFKNPDDIAPCIDALRRVEPPLIDDDRTWIGRKRDSPKVIFCAWIERLEICRKIHIVADKRILVPLINEYFHKINFGADARTFKNDPIKVDAFEALILP